MKKCPICGKSLGNKDEQGLCKSCRKQYRALYRKLKCLAYLENCCANCGRTDSPVLTFHHKDPKTKMFNIAEWICGKAGYGAMTWDEVKTELDKCTVLCFNCHRLVHNEKKELKDFIPYLTKQQRQELESDVIRDDDLFELMDTEDDEMMQDILMEPMDIPVSKNPLRKFSTSSQKRILQEAKLTTQKLAELSIKKLEKRPGGILGIVGKESGVPARVIEQRKTCCYCGEKFSAKNENDLFCSDYCAEQARDEAEENGALEIFDYLMKNGIQMTGSIYHMKQKELFEALGFIQ